MCQRSVTTKEPLSEGEIRAHRAKLRAALRQEGLSVTARRMATYEALLQANDHICVEHILERLHQSHPQWHVNKTTIYRNLDLLAKLGLVHEMRNAEGRSQYELALHGPHGHLLCSACGNIQDIDPAQVAQLEQEMRTRYGFAIELENQALLGLCARCQPPDGGEATPLPLPL